MRTLKSLLFSILAVFLLVSGASATQVRGHLVDANGQPLNAGRIEFVLGGCPTESGPATLVSGGNLTNYGPYPIKAGPGGVIIGQITGSDQILCGGGLNTYWQVSGFNGNSATPVWTKAAIITGGLWQADTGPYLNVTPTSLPPNPVIQNPIGDQIVTVPAGKKLQVTGTFIATLTGNATTASALAAPGTSCATGNYARGIDVSGNATGCTLSTTITGTTNQITASASSGAVTLSLPSTVATTNYTLNGLGTATSGANFGSGTLSFGGSWWNGTTAVSGNVIQGLTFGAGASPTATFTITLPTPGGAVTTVLNSHLTIPTNSNYTGGAGLFNNFVQIGAAQLAGSGSIRLTNTGSIVLRNAANTGDLQALAGTAANTLNIGYNNEINTNGGVTIFTPSTTSRWIFPGNTSNLSGRSDGVLGFSSTTTPGTNSVGISYGGAADTMACGNGTAGDATCTFKSSTDVASAYNTNTHGDRQAIIQNPDFEGSTLIPPPGWSGLATGTESYETVTPFTNKNQSIKMVGVNQFGGMTTLNRFAVVPGDTYSISCAAKTDGTGSAACGIVCVTAAGANSTQIFPTATTSTSWVTLSASGTIGASANSCFVDLEQTSANAGTTIWFDEIVVQKTNFVGTINATTGYQVNGAALNFSNLAGSATVAQGGTGQTTYAVGDLLVASSTSALSRLAIGGTGLCLTSNGTTAVWGSCSTGTASLSANQTFTGTNTFSTTANFSLSGATGAALQVNPALGQGYIDGSTGTSGQGGYVQFTNDASATTGYSAWLTNNAFWNGTSWIQRRGVGTSSHGLAVSNHKDFSFNFAAAVGTNDTAITWTEWANLNVGGFNLKTGVYQINGTQISASNLSNGVSGSGAIALVTSPTFTTPNIGAATATSVSGLTGQITPSAAGGINVGTAALPFSGIFIGAAATNNIRITGTATAARTVTLPDANSNTVQPSTAAANQFATGISAAGVISYAQPSAANLSNGTTGSGAVVLGTSPSIATPTFTGTATAATLNATTLQLGGVDIAAATQTLTGKTFDAEGTGNSLTTVDKLWFPAAGCNNSAPTPYWDTTTTNVPSAVCVTGTNVVKGLLRYTGSTLAAQFHYKLPDDLKASTLWDVRILWLSGTASGTGTLTLDYACSGTGGTSTDDPAWTTGWVNQAVTASATTNAINSAVATGLTSTCSAGALMHFRVRRTDAAGTATNMDIYGVELTYRRTE